MRLGWSSNGVRTSGAVTATAIMGGLGTDVGSSWYRTLDKPSWQPPGEVFGPVWTTLYTLIAIGSARTLDRTPEPADRRRYGTALAANLALNTAWSWLFFRAHRPRWALVESVALTASSADLSRRAAKVDTTSGALLVPYAGWCAVASHGADRGHRATQPRTLTAQGA